MQLPVALLVLAALIIVITDRSSGNAHRSSGVIALAASIIGLLYQAYYDRVVMLAESGSLGFDGMAFNDGIASFAGTTILFIVLLALLLDYTNGLPKSRMLILLAGAGAIITAGAANIITLVLGIGILTLPFYSLVARDSRTPASREASLKFLIISFLSAAVLLLGCALYFASTGSLALHDVTVEPSGQLFFTIGISMILASILFMAGLFPFAAVGIDVHEGAPGNAAGAIAALGATASFTVLLRLLANPIVGNVSSGLFAGLLIIALLTIVGANLLAVIQTDVKRMLACLAASCAGFTLMTAITFDQAAVPGVLFYFAGWTPAILVAMHIAGFASAENGHLSLNDLKGSAYRAPILSVLFTFLLASLVGIPLTIGFMGRILILLPVINQGLTGAAVIAAIAGLGGLYAVLKVIARIFTHIAAEDESEPEDEINLSIPGTSEAVGLWIITVFIVIAGIIPAPLYYLAVLASGHL